MAYRDNLREILDFIGMEQKKLAEKTGLSLKTIENYAKKLIAPHRRQSRNSRPSHRRINRISSQRQKTQKRTAPCHTAPTQRNPRHSFKVEQNQL